MVFLLGRMGDNKRALNLIIERLGDVERVSLLLLARSFSSASHKRRIVVGKALANFLVPQAIEFAKEQNDNDLWEDLLRYSETKPRMSPLFILSLPRAHFPLRPGFIRGLLENVGAEIDPIRLIRRIKNGLEIPGLKGALIKILQDFQLQVRFSAPFPFLFESSKILTRRPGQISLMEGCKSILYTDCRHLALALHDGQTNGFLWTGETKDKLTGERIFPHLAGEPVPAALPFGVRTFPPPSFSASLDVSAQTDSSRSSRRPASSPAQPTSRPLPSPPSPPPPQGTPPSQPSPSPSSQNGISSSLLPCSRRTTMRSRGRVGGGRWRVSVGR